MEIVKTVVSETKTGVCYGLVVNPQDHSVLKKFRGDIQPVKYSIDKITKAQKDALLAFESEFLEEDVEETKEELLTALEADATAKIEAIKPVEKPKEIVEK